MCQYEGTRLSGAALRARKRVLDSYWRAKPFSDVEKAARRPQEARREEKKTGAPIYKNMTARLYIYIMTRRADVIELVAR